MLIMVRGVPSSDSCRRGQFMRTNVTRQFRSRQRKCMGTKRPGTSTAAPGVLTAPAGCRSVQGHFALRRHPSVSDFSLGPNSATSLTCKTSHTTTRVSFVRICDCRIFRWLPHFSHIVHIAYFPHKLAFSTAISILFVFLLGRPISVRFCYQSLLVGCRSELQPLVALLCSTVCCNIA